MPSPCPSRPHRRKRGSLLLEALESRLLLSYTYSVVAPLRGATTGNQADGLVMDAQGDLFGVTANGGPKAYGAVFEIAASSNTVTTLVTFTGPNGISPKGNLVLDADGDLFGTTVGGGAFNKGTIFEVAAGTAHTLTTLASFNGTNGSYPFDGLVADASGDLFGTTLGASGVSFRSTVWELATGSSAITVLATFPSTDRLSGALAINSSGTVFGATAGGGTAAKGSIFQIAGSAHTLTTLASFNGANGNNPDGDLLLDSAGDLIGLTAVGGTDSVGTLFRLNASNNSITTLATFDRTNGNRPIGTLILDGDGNLFGVTTNGGANGNGTIFELPATANTLTTLYSFRGQGTGYNPTGPLVMDSQGSSLWGLTYQGGATNNGIVFEFHNDDSVFATPPEPQALPAARPAPVLQLVITQEPASVGSGRQFVLVIKLEDASGNVVDSNAALTLSLASGPAGGSLAGNRSLRFVDGVAEFASLELRGKGDYTLSAISDSLSLVTNIISVK